MGCHDPAPACGSQHRLARGRGRVAASPKGNGPGACAARAIRELRLQVQVRGWLQSTLPIGRTTHGPRAPSPYAGVVSSHLESSTRAPTGRRLAPGAALVLVLLVSLLAAGPRPAPASRPAPPPPPASAPASQPFERRGAGQRARHVVAPVATGQAVALRDPGRRPSSHPGADSRAGINAGRAPGDDRGGFRAPPRTRSATSPASTSSRPRTARARPISAAGPASRP